MWKGKKKEATEKGCYWNCDDGVGVGVVIGAKGAAEMEYSFEF